MALNIYINITYISTPFTFTDTYHLKRYVQERSEKVIEAIIKALQYLSAFNRIGATISQPYSSITSNIIYAYMKDVGCYLSLLI